MNLLERYLQAIGQYLPPANREDVLAELRANLLDQIDARAEELNRALTEAELADLLRAHGRPEAVAVRYLPQRSLIGPAIFPTYLLVLRKALPFVALIYAVARGASLILSPGARPIGSGIAQAIFGFIPTLLFFWSTVTIVFAVIEYLQAHRGLSLDWTKWDPAKLPNLIAIAQPKQRSLAGRVVNLVMHCVWITFVLLVPRYPFLIIGPGSFYLSSHPIALGPVWHTFYFMLLALLLTQLMMCVLALRNGAERWRPAMDLLTKALGVAAIAVFTLNTNYFIATGPAADLHKLAGLNSAINLGTRFVLFIAIIQLLIELWKYLSPKLPSTTLAF